MIRPAFLLLCLLPCVLAGGCRHFPLGAAGPGDEEGPPRPTRPLPPELAARFTPVHPAWNLRLKLIDSARHHDRFEFSFDTYSEVYQEFRTVTGDYFRARAARADAPAPLILDSPILGGARDSYLADRVFAGWAGKRGYSTLYLHQDADILTAERDGLELDRLLRESVLAYRKALDLFIAERKEVDARRLGSFGISLGGLKNVALIAAEPRLRANVVCLAGADLPLILLESRERMVLRYLKRRKERDGLEPAEVAEEIRRELVAEPLALAEFVAPERVLLFLGSLDDKVPYRSGLLLRRALGRPEMHVVPLGHYTGILAAPRAASLGFAFMAERFQESG